jgi:hypothetical protein
MAGLFTSDPMRRIVVSQRDVFELYAFAGSHKGFFFDTDKG